MLRPAWEFVWAEEDVACTPEKGAPLPMAQQGQGHRGHLRRALALFRKELQDTKPVRKKRK